MISIFFNTRKRDQDYIDHIKKCSNYENEIECFENDGSTSLAESYNNFLFKAKHEIVIFIHDDLILSDGFDKKILNAFEESDYGILGLAGTTFLDKNGIWWQHRSHCCGKVSHLHDGKVNHTKYAPEKKIIQQVCCIDGLFIAVHKERIEMGFDERFEGFHFYDIPFCVLNALKGIKIGVVSGLNITHKSIGEVNDSWHENRAFFEQTFKEHLPIQVNPNIEVPELKIPKKNKNGVSIIIPTLEHYEMLEKCVNSIVQNTKQINYEILIADTGSDKSTIDKIKNNLCNDNIILHEFNYYHFGKINNEMVKQCQYPYVLFSNNDIELLNDGISKMAEVLSSNKDCGTIGARLHYPNKTIQHGGIALLAKGSQLHLSHVGLKTFYQASFKKEKNVFGNTAAFLMIKKSLFNKIGGFIENNISAFEDVILNIETIKLGKKNIYCGDVVCIHHESITRGNLKGMLEAKDMKNILQPYLRKNIRYLKPYINKHLM
ncbi:MAG: glycosyltransferase [Epibacterium sp.]|nr:glycosyltransferase [Epibacterium sp.]NQX75361.1 glycosyltransferase [Epibacterium sp.]